MKKNKKHLRASDVYRLKVITDVRISPGGETIIFAVHRVDKKTKKKYANLWIVSSEGGAAKQFTYGDHIDHKPEWSPEGKRIAFLSNRKDEKQFQIHIIASNGGEARPLTNSKGEFGVFDWSPDVKELVCCFRKKDKEALEREKDEQKKKLGIICRHINRTFYKYDGEGFLPKERWHLCLVNTATGKVKQLTDSPVYDEWSPKWSPDGKSIVYLSNRSKDPDLDPEAIDIFVLSPKTKKIRKIATPQGYKDLPAISPDGKFVAYLGYKGKNQWWRNVHLWLVPFKGKQKPLDITQRYNFTVSSWTINDITGLPALSVPIWLHDSRKIFFQVSEQGSTVLKAISLKNRAVEDIISGKFVVGDISFDAGQKRIAYFRSDMKDTGEVWVKDRTSNQLRQCTHINRDVLAGIDLGNFEEAWIKGASGTKLQGWIIKPPGFDSRKRYPSILEIHGGPQVQYGNAFMFEFYFLAAQGYVVHFCNPRGSIGYGESHTRAIWNNWGAADYRDLMRWTDYLSAKPYIDPQRMGVTGGSYGGYMTNWIIGHTRRFKAAVTQRCVSNLISMWGSSDVNWYFQVEFGNQPPWENFRNYLRQSPVSFIGNAKTPTLVIHSEQDMRCAMEQSEQIYVALKKLGIDTELVLFPDEPHGLSRGGRADRRVKRLEHILRWFDRYLKKKHPLY